jgi:hypothetical protein
MNFQSKKLIKCLLKKNSNFEVSFFEIGDEIWLWRNSENGASRLTGGHGIRNSRRSPAESHRRGRTAKIRYARKISTATIGQNLNQLCQLALSRFRRFFTLARTKRVGFKFNGNFRLINKAFRSKR